MMNFLSMMLLLFLQPVQYLSSYEEGYRMIEEISVENSSHQSWNELLKKFVDQDGNVDYRRFKKDEAILDQYLEFMSENMPGGSASREDKLVYYINLYNAATVKLILENYPVRSIKDIKSPWDKKWVKIRDKTVSLGAIEHKVLRKLNEPRIHFAINCASYSCPKLSNKAYTVDNLEAQLENASREFVNDRKRNRIGADGAEISEIFKWYKGDFTEKGSIKNYINQYSDVPIAEGTKLKYIKYDWSLNEIK